MILLQQMMILFVFMIIGYYLARKGMLDDKISRFLSYLIVNVANPCLVLSGCIADEFLQRDAFLMVAALAVGVYVVLLLLAELVIPRFIPSNSDQKKNEQDIYKLMLVFSNIGFMGFPIIEALYGSFALIYGAVFLLPYNFLIYTYGIKCIKGKMENAKMVFKLCFNVGTIASILAITISLLQIRIPDAPAQAIEMLSGLAAPLSMMVIGASFAGKNFKELFGDVRLLAFSAVKLLLLPILGGLIIRQITPDPVLQGICMVILSTPVGSMSAMMARTYDGNFDKASQGVAVTTILSIVTMPVVFAIMGL